MEGIAKAKARGVYNGRKASIDRVRVRALLSERIRPSDVARQLGISQTSVWRLNRSADEADGRNTGARS